MAVDKHRFNVAVSITNGRAVRDLFYNGFLGYLTDAGADVTIFTEATAVREFIERWRRPGVEFEWFSPCPNTVQKSRAFWMRRRIVKLRSRTLLNSWIRLEEKVFYKPDRRYISCFKKVRPHILFTTDISSVSEEKLISSAHSLGIPTLGFVQSWDNVHKGLRSRPRYLAIWNMINKREAVELEGYPEKDIEVVGAPQFDAYFAPDAIWGRERLASHFNLDPKRPIILYATLGSFIPGLDETCWMEHLTSLITYGVIKGRPQVICRLHPWSRIEHFSRYAAHPDVRLSYIDRYLPALTWYMDRSDTILMANMLRHADLVVTPGSTVTLESAIFDRPTIFPLFHSYQPQRAKEYFDTWLFGKHFKRIEALELVPIIKRPEDFASAVNRALEDPSWYREERARLVKDYAHFTDGNSTKRLAEAVIRRCNINPSPILSPLRGERNHIPSPPKGERVRVRGEIRAE